MLNGKSYAFAAIVFSRFSRVRAGYTYGGGTGMCRCMHCRKFEELSQ